MEPTERQIKGEPSYTLHMKLVGKGGRFFFALAVPLSRVFLTLSSSLSRLSQTTTTTTTTTLKKFRWPVTPKSKREASDVLDRLISRAKKAKSDHHSNFGLDWNSLMDALAYAIYTVLDPNRVA